MTNSSTQFGYSLLELLIAVITILTLAFSGVALVEHYSIKYTQLNKIKYSIEMLHDSLNAYYFNNANHNISLSVNDLIREGYLQKQQIYNINKLYVYKLSINPQTLNITIYTTSKVLLQSLNPTSNGIKVINKDKHKIYYFYYQWRYPALLPTNTSYPKRPNR